jgi:hypothetical protein
MNYPTQKQVSEHSDRLLSISLDTLKRANKELIGSPMTAKQWVDHIDRWRVYHSKLTRIKAPEI